VWTSFRPCLRVLGLRPHQRRTDRLGALAAGLATEVAYAKAARFLSELTGIRGSARTIRNDVVAVAPHRLGPEVSEVPILLLDSTGERAGDMLRGTKLHLALGLMARHRQDGRVVCSVRLLGATLDETWTAMGRLLEKIRPGLILLDGEGPLSDMVAERFPEVPVQRCLWHLVRGMTYTAWREGASKAHRRELRARLADLLADAHREQDLSRAQSAYQDLIVEMEAAGVVRAARYLKAAAPEVFTFISHPDAGRLLFGDKGRPELATGVLERVMRELNRRTDVGVRWSIDGCRALLMLKARPEVSSPGVAVEQHDHRPTKSAVPPRGMTSMSTQHPAANLLQVCVYLKGSCARSAASVVGFVGGGGRCAGRVCPFEVGRPHRRFRDLRFGLVVRSVGSAGSSHLPRWSRLNNPPAGRVRSALQGACCSCRVAADCVVGSISRQQTTQPCQPSCRNPVNADSAGTSCPIGCFPGRGSDQGEQGRWQ
jgi:hypothetical protein